MKLIWKSDQVLSPWVEHPADHRTGRQIPCGVFAALSLEVLRLYVLGAVFDAEYCDPTAAIVRWS